MAKIQNTNFDLNLVYGKVPVSEDPINLSSSSLALTNLLSNGSLYVKIPESTAELGAMYFKVNNQTYRVSGLTKNEGKFSGAFSILSDPWEEPEVSEYNYVRTYLDQDGKYRIETYGRYGYPVFFEEATIPNAGSLTLYVDTLTDVGQTEQYYYAFVAPLKPFETELGNNGFGFFEQTTETLVACKGEDPESGYQYQIGIDENGEPIWGDQEDILYTTTILAPKLMFHINSEGINLYRNKVINFFDDDFYSVNKRTGYTRYYFGNYVGLNGDSTSQVNILTLGYTGWNPTDGELMQKNYLALNESQMTLYGNNYTSMRFGTKGISLVGWSERWHGSESYYKMESVLFNYNENGDNTCEYGPYTAWNAPTDVGNIRFSEVPTLNLDNFILEVTFCEYAIFRRWDWPSLYHTVRIPLSSDDLQAGAYRAEHMITAYMKTLMSFDEETGNKTEMHLVGRQFSLAIEGHQLFIRFGDARFLEDDMSSMISPSWSDLSALVPTHIRLIRTTGSLDAPTPGLGVE